MYTPGTWDRREQEEEDGMDVVILLCRQSLLMWPNLCGSSQTSPRTRRGTRGTRIAEESRKPA